MQRMRLQGERERSLVRGNMADFLKGVLVTLMIVLYVVSPLDFFPGPIDDFAVIILGIISTVGKKIEG